MDALTIQSIFIIGYVAYEQSHALPAHLRKAAWSIMNCRTAALGGHIQACPDGHFQRNHYNSCKHRMCPQCAFIQVQEWLEKQKLRLLACDHFHVIFTIPHELNCLWKLNSKLMTDLLFQSSKETIFELLSDEKRLGGKPGIIATLHTWTKTLRLHPHIHCLVTGGCLKNGKWVASKDYLFPFAVARELFKGKCRSAILKAVYEDKLILPLHMTPQRLENLLNKLGRKKWNVRICEKYDHGIGVVTYLARYIKGGPISNSRIINLDKDRVTFNVGREKKMPLTLSVEEFIERFLQHVPLPNSMIVRSYGLYSSSKKDDLNKCRELLGQGPVSEFEKVDWQTHLERCFEDNNYFVCPVCKKRLIRKPGLLILKIPDDKREFTEQKEAA